VKLTPVGKQLSIILHAVCTNPYLRGYLYRSINVVLDRKLYLGLSEESLLLFGALVCYITRQFIHYQTFTSDWNLVDPRFQLQFIPWSAIQMLDKKLHAWKSWQYHIM